MAATDVAATNIKPEKPHGPIAMLPDYPHALVTIAFEEWRQAGFPNAAKLDININNQDWAILFAVLNPDVQPRRGWRALVFRGDINVGNRTEPPVLETRNYLFVFPDLPDRPG